MGRTNFPNGLNVGDAASGTADFMLGGTIVTTTAAELNALGTGLSATELDYLDGATAGTVVASKAVVVDANKAIDTLDIAASGLKIATVAVTASAAELNNVDGILGNALAYDNAGFRILASGSTAITGIGTVATGLANVQHVVGSLAGVVTAGTAAATDAVTLIVDPVTVGGGSVIFRCLGPTGINATTAGTVNWMALGTAA